ncbi:MAG: TolC family protein, partial [Victivallales bacterium]|nr:TolC family protein [Victivallales bacterium]
MRKIHCLTAVLLSVWCGCRTARQWREQADSRAAEHLRKAQAIEGVPVESIRVETPADTLRRRLFLDQGLSRSSPASASIRDLASEKGGRFAWNNAEHLTEGEAYQPRWDTSQTIRISLVDALMIAACNSREFQNQKDSLFQCALALDLEDHHFQNSFRGMFTERFTSSAANGSRTNGLTGNAFAEVTRTFRNGAELTASLSVDLVKMLSHQHGSSWGPMADASISIPLLRGSGEFVVLEPLKQAERNLLYQVRAFEQFKRTFVVSVATSYLNVLQAGQTIENQAENYKRVITSTRRSRRMADAGLLPEYQFDQSVQNELAARDNWVRARQSYENSLDSFKILLGLPPDASVEVDAEELRQLQKWGETLGGNGSITDYQNGEVPAADAPVELTPPDNADRGPFEIEEGKAISIALTHRPDLQTLRDRIGDAQRKVLIARDSLRAELTIGASVSMGEGRTLSQAGEPHGSLHAHNSFWSAPLTVDLPWERTSQRNSYRNSIIALEQAVRTFQGEEDTIKQSIRTRLRALMQNRSSVVIQREAVKLAVRRVDSTSMLLEAGRAEIRDVLEAQSALL